MSDVIKAIEGEIARLERTLADMLTGKYRPPALVDSNGGAVELPTPTAHEIAKDLEFWREQHVLTLRYRDHLEQRQRFAEMEQQTETHPPGAWAFGVARGQGQPQ